MDINRKIAIYSRKSKLTEKGDSIKNQVNMCRNHLSIILPNHDETDVVVYEDEGYSGGNINRPEFQKMMHEVKNKRIRMICCYRIDRISRNMRDLTALVDELEYYEVDFVSITEQFDTSSPTGRLMLNILSSFAQFERDSIAQRITDNKYELSKTGIWLGGKSPTGYKSVPVEYTDKNGKTKRYFKLELIEEQANTVKYIFEQYLSYQALTQVETKLLNEGVQTKTGKNFTRQTIKAILQNPVYMIADQAAYEYYQDITEEIAEIEDSFNGINGMMVYNKTKQVTGKTIKMKDESEWIIAVGEHEGIISGEDWLKAKSILDKNKEKGYRRPRSNPSLLSGIIRCGNCGAYMRPKMFRKVYENGDRSFSYLCETKDISHKQQCDIKNVDGNKLDKMVCDEILRISSNQVKFDKQVANLRNFYLRDNTVSTDIENIDKLISDKKKGIANLVNALIDNESQATVKILSAKIEEMTLEVDILKEKKAALEVRKSNSEMQLANFEAARQTLKSFHTYIANTPREHFGRIIKSVVDRVIWDGTNAHIYLIGASPEGSDGAK